MLNKTLKKPQVGDPICQTTVSTGAEEVVLLQQEDRQGFYSAFGGGSQNTFLYFICHQTAHEWEVGTGYMRDAATLVRDTVIASSDNGRRAKFSAGHKDVIHDICDIL